MPLLPSVIAENGSMSTRSQVGLPLLNCAATAPSVGPEPSSLTAMPFFLEGLAVGCVVGLESVAAPVHQDQFIGGGFERFAA